jgi:ribosomal protein S18 acetylase RimI-like enzyme
MAACLAALRKRGYADAILWVLADNPRARAFYEREGWALDGAEKTDEFLGVAVRELRYRIALSG